MSYIIKNFRFVQYLFLPKNLSDNEVLVMKISDVILVITATATALMAGIFFAFSCAVNSGLVRLPDSQHVAAMQSINRRIQNPVFFAAFSGASLLLPISAFLHYGQTPRLLFLLAATVIYLTGAFGVTVFGNVPLNNTLDRFDLESSGVEEITLQRANFEKRWNNLNTIRTVSSTLAVTLVVIACLSPN